MEDIEKVKAAVPDDFIQFIKNAMSSFKCSAHDENHVFRVSDLALKIACELKLESANCSVNFTIVYVAALTHDILDSKLVSGDVAISNESILRDELIKFLSLEECHAVFDVIMSVGYKNMLRSDWDPHSKSIEYKCVQDADLLDAIGAVGIGRCYSFGGGRNRELFSVVDSSELCTRDKYISPESRTARELSCAQHFFDKLLRLSSMMTTIVGKRFAEKRQNTMLSFLEALADELEESGSSDGQLIRRKLSSFKLK